MPRAVFNASLFHLSPDDIGFLSRDDTYQMSLGWSPYRGGFLLQAEARAGQVLNELPAFIRPIYQIAPRETTHLFLHENNPVLSLPTFAQLQVREARSNPPFWTLCDDSVYAKNGYEKLRKDRAFNGSPLYFEKKANRLIRTFSEFAKGVTEMRAMEASLDEAYTLACGVEYTKLDDGLEDQWSDADLAFEAMGSSLDPIIDAFDDLYSKPMLYSENVLLATRSRIYRSLRVAAEWRRTLSPWRWREAGISHVRVG